MNTILFFMYSSVFIICFCDKSFVCEGHLVASGEPLPRNMRLCCQFVTRRLAGPGRDAVVVGGGAVRTVVPSPRLHGL